MSSQSICAPPPSEKDFTIVYNQHKIQISKFKLAVFSPRFRQIPNFIDARSFSITGAAPIATFNVFIKGAQGEQLAITKENALDLVQLAEEWQVEQIKEEAFKFISQNPDLEAIFEKIKSTHEEGSTEALESVIASHLDAALDLQSFYNFPLDVLARILVSKDRILNNHHKLYNFVMKMFDQYDSKASVLIPGVDIRLLSPQEALKLLEHPALQKDNNNSTTLDASTNLIRENVALKEEVAEIKDMMHDVINRIQKLEEFNSKMAVQRKNLVEQTQKQYAEIIAKLDFLGSSSASGGSPDLRISKLDSKIESTAKLLRDNQSKKVADLEAKTQKDLKKTQTTVDTLSKKISSIEAKYEMLTNDSAEIKKNLSTIYQRAESVGKSIESQPGAKKIQSIPIIYNGTSTNGIFAKLSQDSHGNVHENHIVTISASSTSHCFPYQVANTNEWNDCWISQNKPDQWIQFDFINKVVMLQHYTIKTHRYSKGSCHLKSWKVEGSNDGELWEVIDKEDNDLLNEENKEATFECQKKDGAFRYIRLLQTGPNHRGDHMLALTRIEFYGFLISQE